jgi:hypothetical protein
MTATITFFPVGNGDMTLISLADGSETRILVDCNIRDAADDPDDDTRDVAKDLRDRLKRDAKGRPYVDAFLLSHPDQDHCNGLTEHFHLGDPADYPDDKKPDGEKRIFIREIWSSPMVFRRASKEHTLCDDATAFNTEAKRRVKVNRDKAFTGIDAGNRILILGEDEDGKTDDLKPILVPVDTIFTRINGSYNQCFEARLLAPLPKSDDDTEDTLSKNHSSTILNMAIAANPTRTVVRQFLTGGDAEVAIWERLWEKHQRNPSVLEYDLLQTPHHCSWHTLSYDSWSELHEDAEVSQDARSALSQIRSGGIIVASSDPIEDDDNDPPCWGAKLEYEAIAKEADGGFLCTGEHPDVDAPAPLEFSISEQGLARVVRKTATAGSLLRPAAAASAFAFPNKPVVPNKPAGFA